MAKILIIDDEKSILDMLKLHFETKQYTVFTASNAKDGLELLTKEPDLILLDINMPDVSGIDFCIKVRQHISCPIIFLTAKVSENDKINGFMVGGDDYITKPFSINELFARVEAHLRRENRSHNKTKRKFSDELIINYDKYEVYINDNLLDFSKKEFEIIQLLSMNSGQIFDKEKIYELVWGYDADGDSNVVKEHISKIRLKLSEYSDTVYLETVYGVGYKWKR